MAATPDYGTGRRKTSTARVYMQAGTGRITVNERPLDEFLRARDRPHDRGVSPSSWCS